ncbi:MAG: 50S ribosomal protein L25 [Parachlamydiales bacterium]|nr:50S ribosomal protein L25 [Parachlamydiales bacterium]
MELEVFKREKESTNKLRILKNIPAVLYAKGMKNENIFLKTGDFKNKTAHLKPGDLSTTIFTLKQDNKSIEALVKDIQYHVTTYAIIHIDFYKLDDKTPISVNVPIRFSNVQDCIGIKHGGNVRQVIRTVKVRCLKKYMPKEFILDVANLDMNDVLRISDIKMPENVFCETKNLNEVVVIIAKR